MAQQESSFVPDVPGFIPDTPPDTQPTVGVRPGNITPPVFGPTPPPITGGRLGNLPPPFGKPKEQPWGTRAWNWWMKEPLVSKERLAQEWEKMSPEEKEWYGSIGKFLVEEVGGSATPFDVALMGVPGAAKGLTSIGMRPGLVKGVENIFNLGMTGRGAENIYGGIQEGEPGQAIIGGLESAMGLRGLGAGGQLKRGFNWMFPGRTPAAGPAAAPTTAPFTPTTAAGPARAPMKPLGDYFGTESGMHPTPENVDRATKVLWKYGDDVTQIKNMSPEQIIDAAVKLHPDEFAHAPISSVLITPENYQKATEIISKVAQGPINLEGKSPGDIIDIAAGLRPQAFEGVVTFPPKSVTLPPGPITTPPNIQRVRSRASIGTEEFLAGQPTAFGRPVKGPVITPVSPKGAISPEYQIPKGLTSGFEPAQYPPVTPTTAPPTGGAGTTGRKGGGGRGGPPPSPPPTGGTTPPPAPPPTAAAAPPGDPEILKRAAVELFNLPRAMKASLDMSPVGRQGRPLILEKAWWQSWEPMVKAWGSKGAADRIKAQILSRPNFQPRRTPGGLPGPSFAQESGLRLSGIDPGLTNKEEILMSTWAAKIPGIAGSNRAYEAFLNSLRATHFDHMIEWAENMGLNPRGNPDTAKAIARFINEATGRGGLPTGAKVKVPGTARIFGAPQEITVLPNLERYASALNTIFFAPRLTARMVQMPWGMINPNIPKELRMQYIKANLSSVGAWLAFTSLADMAGKAFNKKVQVGWDITSPDFGKAKIGNTRIDVGEGYLQWLVLIGRLAKGEYTSSETGETRPLGQGGIGQDYASLVGNFARNKLNIPFKLLIDFMLSSQRRHMNFTSGVTKGGPLDLMENTAVQQVMPMFIEDMYDVWKENPDAYEFLGFAIPAFFGGATQTYGGERRERF